MQDMIFSDGAMLGYGITAAVYLLLPCAALIQMLRHNAARIYPVIVGAIVWFVSVRLCDLTVSVLLLRVSFALKTVYAAECIAYFEEPGRWLAMKCPLTDIRKPGDAVCYGIGHAGAECLNRALSVLQTIRLGQTLNGSGVQAFLADQTPEKAAETLKMLHYYADGSLFSGMLGACCAVTNFGVHLALSLLIFRKIREYHVKRRWLLLAILLHLLLNAVTWLASFSGRAWVVSLTGIAAGIGIIALIMRIIDGASLIDAIRYPLADDTE
ncbi:MAG: YhfC family intramembrane metalloprotease [Oscillospiraceae bacterium]|nr:YhfC family intramembrane metalloprotease [Oscillospiraceae bacterium]